MLRTSKSSCAKWSLKSRIEERLVSTCVGKDQQLGKVELSDHRHTIVCRDEEMYLYCAKDQEEPIEEVRIVRHIAGTFFRLV